ncbi:uncharacterized protein A4U43_C05F14700 [Asparagus officinalis]|uniref:Pentacotripeptide-repeat region of PRORP domain-containing protein n=2 Tax=Asparagus officinalis TaxID=4686 RepID=A0A5P1ESP1_ASPOF|nr:uncharacterized protein A4U43_C05F14700 [Asparagus officinalis]
MVAVLKELQNQGEGTLAFQVFEEVRKEHWYKPQLSVYVDMITVLANNGLKEKVEQICSYLKKECLEPDTEGFNMLLRTLLNFGFNNTAMDCFRLMKLWESEPDESTFRILINGLESNGELDLLLSVKDEAEKYFDGNLEFLEEGEQLILNEV